MDPDTLIRRRFAESADVNRALQADDHVAFVADVADVITGALRAGGKVLLCGNGGSAADAMHLAAELVGRYKLEREALPAISLSDNASAVTCIANDYDYEQTFARQVRAFGRRGDVLIALSTSGSSANVLAATAAAKEIGMRTVGMTGTRGEELSEATEFCLSVPSEETARIQEGYMLVGHTLCELVERALFA